MVSLMNRSGLIFVFVGTLSACGGSTTGGSEGTGGGSSTGGSGVVGGATSSTCDVAGATVAQLQLDTAAVTCVKSSCSEKLAICLGANYAHGDYGNSNCAPFGNCVAACNCVGACSSSCTAPDACVQCLSSNLLACAVTHHCL